MSGLNIKNVKQFALALAILFGGSKCLAQLAVINAGASTNFAAQTGALGYAWQLDGGALTNSGSNFTYSSGNQDVGTHWISAVTFWPGSVQSNQNWEIRVRISLPTSGTNYYVATNGFDSNAGTLAAPFLTLERARNAIRTNGVPVGGVSVWIHGGLYWRTNTFVLTNSDSGLADAPVVYRAYPGEMPVFTTGTSISSNSFTVLDSSLWSRVTPGVTATNILQLDLAALGIVNKGRFPAKYNTCPIVNPYSPTTDGGLCELFFNGQRQLISRYPNNNPTNRWLTPYMMMNGVLAKFATNYMGTNIGGMFYYNTNDASHIQRWQIAAAETNLWIQGFWRVPWETEGVQVLLIDTVSNTIATAPGAVAGGGGFGNKYTGYAGSYNEPYWALNLLEEIDQPGEWSIDFARNKLYFLPPSTVTNGAMVISDFASPVMQLTTCSNIVISGLAFNISLAQGIVITNSVNNLVQGCAFTNLGSYAVDLNRGSSNGVVDCNMAQLAAGGVLVLGGSETNTPRISCGHYVVNNDINEFAWVVPVYAAGIDAGFGGTISGGGGGHTVCVGARIAHNHLKGTPHGPVLRGSFDKTFEYNYLEEFGTISGDLGGIYIYTPTNQGGYDILRYNYMYCPTNYLWPNYMNPGPCGEEGIQNDQPGPSEQIYGNIATGERGGYMYNGTITNGSFYNNLAVGCGSECGAAFQFVSAAILTVYATNVAALGNITFTGPQTGTNFSYPTDPGFINWTNQDLRLYPTSVIYSDQPGFGEIPFEMIGLYNDEIRTNATPPPPVICNQPGAVGVTNTSVTFNGQLIFPWLTPDTSVRIFWGTNDGGTNVLNWTNSINLGISVRAMLATTVTGLAPNTTYYYRFQASNSTTVVWATNTVAFSIPADAFKANNNTSLNLASSWVNATPPTPTNLATWEGTVTTANTVSLGADLNWGGIRITNVGGAVAVNAGNTLTLGASGLNLSGAYQNLTLNCGLSLGLPQVWTIGSGITLLIGGNITNNGNALNIAGSGSTVLSGNIIGAGGLTNLGTGTLLLNGNAAAATNTWTVSGGFFGGTGTNGGDVVMIAGAGLVPGGAGNVGTLTLTNNLILNANTLFFDLATNTPTTNDLVTVGNRLTINGANYINLTIDYGWIPAGNYTLMTFANGRTVSGTLTLAGGITNNVSLQLNANSLVLQVGAGGIHVNSDTWKGYVNGTWDASALNWTNGRPIVPFANNDAVIFDDTLAGNSTITNAMPGTTISPGSVTFNNNLTNYTINANIAGTNSLAIFGLATVTLSGTNSYSGNTTINAGKLVVKNGGTIKSPTGTLNIGAQAGTAGVLTLSNSSAITVQTLLVTNLTCGESTNSFFNFNGGTLTTSNGTGIGYASGILLASNVSWAIGGNWSMNGGTNIISNVATNSSPAASVYVGNGTNNLQVIINSNAVWWFAIPTNSSATNTLDLTVGNGNATNNVVVVNNGTLVVTNAYGLNGGVNVPIIVGNSSGSDGNRLIITNGGQVFTKVQGNGAPPCGDIGAGTGPNNGLIVAGANAAGRKAMWNLGADRLNVGINNGSNSWVSVGQGGLITNVAFFVYDSYSSLFITNGGQMYASTCVIGRNGFNDSLIVAGTDAAGNPATLAFINGTLTIGGGTQTPSSPNPGTNTMAVVSQGGLITNANSVTVGQDTNSIANTLMVTNGGQVFSTGNSYVGYANGCNSNSVTIGGGSGTALWNLANHALTIGNSTNAMANYATLFTGGVLTNVSSVILSGINSALNFNGGMLAAGSSGSLLATNATTVNATNLVQAGGARINSGTYTVTNQLPLTHDPALSSMADGGLSKLGNGTLTLSNTNNYNGATTINAGTLALGTGGSLSNTTQIAIAAGAIFDASALAANFSFASNQTLAGLSTTNTAAINLAANKTMTLASGAQFSFQATSNSVGKISVIGSSANLTLNNNAVTINVTGPALSAGTNRLLDCTGTLTGSANPTPAITGTTLGNSYAAIIRTTTGIAGHVDLVVTGPLKFNSVMTGTNGSLQLNGTDNSGYSGRAYVLQAATNLASPISWLPILTNNATNGVFNFSDLQATNFPSRFYRLTTTN